MKNVKQISKMLGVIVEHLVEFAKMSVDDCQWVIQNPKKAIWLTVVQLSLHCRAWSLATCWLMVLRHKSSATAVICEL